MVRKNHTDVVMRRAKPSDQEGIKQVVFTVFREYGFDPAGSATNAELDDLEGVYFARGGWFEVLCRPPSRVVGCWGLSPLSTTVVELRKMYLLASERKQGFGKAMLERALVKARELGFGEMQLETASTLREAIGLYRSYGFVPFTGERHSQQCDQSYRLSLLGPEAAQGDKEDQTTQDY